MVLCQIVRNGPQNHFWAKNKNQHPILNPCVKFQLNSLRNKKVTENLIFDATSGLKLEMTSYSDNAFDVTIFCCFEMPLAYTPFLRSFIVVRPQMAELNWGGFSLSLPPPPSIIGVSWTPSKIGLRMDSKKNLSYKGEKSQFPWAFKPNS